MVAKELLYDVLSSLEYNHGEEVKEFDNLLNSVWNNTCIFNLISQKLFSDRLRLDVCMLTIM